MPKQMRVVDADRVRKLADVKGWNNKDIALKALIDAGTVAAALDKRKAISLESIVKLAQAFRVEPGELILQQEDDRPLAKFTIKIDMEASSEHFPEIMTDILSTLASRSSSTWEFVGVSITRGSVVIRALADDEDFGKLLTIFESGDLSDLKIVSIIKDTVLAPLAYVEGGTTRTIQKYPSQSEAAEEVPVLSRKAFEIPDELKERVEQLLKSDDSPLVGTDWPHIPNRYRLTQKLETYPYQEKWMAYDECLQRAVVITTLRRDKLHSYYAQMLVEQAQIHARLWHPNVLPLLDANIYERDGEIAYFPFLITPCLEGALLSDSRLPLSPLQGTLIALAAAKGLKYIHEHGIVHCGISPNNIFLPSGSEQNERVLITDFWAALDSHKRRTFQDGPTMGRHQFMAPEQCRRDWSTIDVRTDIHSLGATLFFILAGISPYPQSSRRLILGASDNTPPLRLRVAKPGLPKSLENICATCLAADASDRFASADLLIEALMTARLKMRG